METTGRLDTIVASLMRDGAGILAADESIGTMDRRLVAVDADATQQMRRAYRELLFTAPDIERYLSGVILFDQTIRSATEQGVPFPDLLTARGILPGIKVDLGTVPLTYFPDEVITEGLDGLAERLNAYHTLGARFTKWRAVYTIGASMPTPQCIEANAFSLARFAVLSQEAGLVPMVEPEVIHEGDHDIQRAADVTHAVLSALFDALRAYRADLSGVILKSSMVLAGNNHAEPSSPEEVADATLRVFRETVPKDIGGIVFLSGGQTPKQATANLQAIANHGTQSWKMTFSFARALQEPVLATWRGEPERVPAAQAALLTRLKHNALAQQGRYDSAADTA